MKATSSSVEEKVDNEDAHACAIEHVSNPLPSLQNYPLIMERIVRFIPKFADRVRLEQVSKRMEYYSGRSLYMANNENNSVVDLHFSKLTPVITVSVVGNDFDFPALVTENRYSTPEAPRQPTELLQALQGIRKRVGKQIREIRIGGVDDRERLFCFVPDHQLVLTKDLCEVFDEFPNVDSVVLRGACLTTAAIDFWGSGMSRMMCYTTSVCFHGIWFQSGENLRRLGSILWSNLRRMNLSDCSAKCIGILVERLRLVRAKLDSVFVVCDHYTFGNRDIAVKMLEGLSEVSKEICLHMTTTGFSTASSCYWNLMYAIPKLVHYDSIAELEFELGMVSDATLRIYRAFFTDFGLLTRLRVLRISGEKAVGNYRSLVPILMKGLSVAPALEEFYINGAKEFHGCDMERLCSSLPTTLVKLFFGDAFRIRSKHISVIAQRCEGLRVLCLHGVSKLTTRGLADTLSQMSSLEGFYYCPEKLNKFALAKMFADRFKVPRLLAFVIDGYKSATDGVDVFKATRNRFPWSRVQADRLLMWLDPRALDEILACTAFASCPACLRDISLLPTEDFD